MYLEADTHCHTIASMHAYSTVVEMAQYASQAGLKAIAVTDHGPALPDGAHPWHFGNLKCLPPFICGVRVIHGAEANIINFSGEIDLDVDTQKRLDWIVASFHDPACNPGTPAQHTEAYLKLAENPFIDVIGHCGTESFKFDYERVLPVFKQKNILVEINSHSFEVRAGAPKNCREIALICKKYKIPVAVNSDAHSCFSVGDVKAAKKVLDEIGFPEELIINRTYERLRQWIIMRRGRDIGEYNPV